MKVRISALQLTTEEIEAVETAIQTVRFLNSGTGSEDRILERVLRKLEERKGGIRVGVA